MATDYGKLFGVKSSATPQQTGGKFDFSLPATPAPTAPAPRKVAPAPNPAHNDNHHWLNDFINGAVGDAGNVAHGVGDFLAGALRATPRAAASMVESVQKPDVISPVPKDKTLAPKHPVFQPSADFTPGSGRQRLASLVYGDEPIYSLQDQSAQAHGTIKDFLTKKGMNPKMAAGLAGFLAPAGVGVGTALDATSLDGLSAVVKGLGKKSLQLGGHLLASGELDHLLPEGAKVAERGLTLFNGANKQVSQVSKSYNRVLSYPTNQKGLITDLANHGDKQAQELLGDKNFFVKADSYIKQKFGNKYDAVKYENQQSPTVGSEYHDFKDGKFYSQNETTARVYSYQNRAGKYAELPPGSGGRGTNGTGGGTVPSEDMRPPTGFDKAKSTITSTVNKIYTEFLDRFHPLSSLAKKAGKESDVAMRNAITGYYGSGSIAKYHLDYQLSPILKNVNVDHLRTAATALRDIELGGRGIRGSNTSEIIDNLVKEGTKDIPKESSQIVGATKKLEDLRTQLGEDGMQKLGKALKGLYKYQDDMVKKYLVDTGIMSQESYTGMKSKNQFYVPFQRVMQDVNEWLGVPSKRGAGSVGSQDIIKGIKGSDLEIKDPLESVIENTYKMVGIGKRQQVAQEIVGLADKLPEGTVQKVGRDQVVHANNSIQLFENGKVTKYRVPSEVADAARGLTQEGYSTMVNMLNYPTAIFRATTTGINPEFAIPNISRDLQTAFVNMGLNPLTFVKGLAHYMKKDDVYQKFLQAGSQTSRMSVDPQYLKENLDQLSGKRGFNIAKPSDLYHVLENIGSYSEQPTRIAAFEKAYRQGLKKGMSEEDALKAGANWAQESTVNFARRGSKTQSLNVVYAFLNARAQGVDRIVRSLKNDPVGATLRLGMMTVAPALALHAWNRNFASYNDQRIVTQSDRQNNFIIMLSDSPIGQLGGAQYLKIPKEHVGTLANPVEDFLSYLEGQAPDVKGDLSNVLQAFSPLQSVGDIIPTALKPPVEWAFNKSTFTGQSIVPDYKTGYPAPYQYSSYTSPVYRTLGRLLNLPPAKIQNTVEGYLGGYARIGENVASKFAPAQDKTKSMQQQGTDINSAPVVRRFLGGARRTPQEQALSNTSKVKSGLFQMNQIKAAGRRGDIPPAVAEQQIRQMQQQLEKTRSQK